MSMYSSYSAWEDQQQATKEASFYEKATAILDELQIPYDSLDMLEESPISIFFGKYAHNKQAEKGILFDKLLKEYQFNYNLSIRDVIYTLLCSPIERNFDKPEAQYSPGILSIQNNENTYCIDTILGTIHVNKASEIFKHGKCSSIFYKKLVKKCYARTFEFVEKMPNDYQAVILSSPHYFGGKLYHAYAEGKDHIVDVAANAYYPNKEEASIPLSGEVLAKLSYEEILEEFDKIPKEFSFLPEDYGKDKIYCLTMYYAYQKDKANL